MEKRISDLESRENYLSGSCQLFFIHTSSSASKIHLKSGNLQRVHLLVYIYIYILGLRPSTRQSVKLSLFKWIFKAEDKV